MSRSPEAWARDFIAGAKSCAEVTKLRKIVDNPWTGAGRYYATRGKLAKAEIDRVFADAAKRCGLSGLGKPGDRLSLKQVRKLRAQLDRSGYADLRAGECRKVAPSVTVCRNTRGEYRVTEKRSGNRTRI